MISEKCCRGSTELRTDLILKLDTNSPNGDSPVTESMKGDSRYPWFMVLVAAVAMVATLPGRTHGLGMITERLLSDPAFELTRAGYGQLNLWAALLGSLFCLGIGTWIDRCGIRLTLSVTMFTLGLVVLAMTRSQSLGALFLALTLSRGFGQSALSVVSISIIGKWFDRRVSVPMAVYSVLVAIGFIAIALVGREYAEIDWRILWSVIGWTILGTAVLFVVVVRDRSSTLPSDRGEEPSESTSEDFKSGEALKTPFFWVCSIGLALYGMVASGISLFNESIFVDQGFPKEIYYDSLAMGTGIGIIANLLTGWLGIHLSMGRLLSIALMLLSGSLVWLTALTQYFDVMGFVLLNATAGGMLTVLFFTVWRQIYGRQHLGKIQGVAQMMTVIASAFGPLVFASVRDATGSYSPLLWTLSTCVLALAGVAWVVPVPVKKTNPPLV